MKLDYTLRDASWQPTYDARLRDGAKTIELTYQGLVRQSSGEDWTDVDLTLSTARPALGGNVPRLNPWIVDIDAPNAYYGAEMAMQDVPAPMPQAAPIARTSAKMAMPAPAPKLAEARLATAEVSSGAASASFHIPVPATLNSDGSAQKVTIARLEMPAKLRYLAAPALRETAYLEAETRNDSDYPLLPGTLNTFLGNSFVASGHLRGVMPGESFELALGADEGIGIERKLVKRYTDSSGLIGNRTRVNYEFRIDVRNNHKNAERVQFEDQLPVSRNEQIHVTLAGTQGAGSQARGRRQAEVGLDPATRRETQRHPEVQRGVSQGPGGQRPRLALAKRRPRHRLERVISKAVFDIYPAYNPTL
ncbi:mucoidy inhibitor A [Pseudomonas aeruginosa]|nr:mucoidy inhibitor A [Pseudomonas aeruginosa]